MKTKLISMLLLLSIIISCRKDQQSNNSNSSLNKGDSLQTLSLAQVKDWYSQNAPNSALGNLNTAANTSAKKTFSLASLPFTWDKVQSINNKKGNYWLVYLGGQPTFKNIKQGYRKIAFIRDSTGKIQSRILEIIPDAIYLQRN